MLPREGAGPAAPRPQSTRPFLRRDCSRRCLLCDGVDLHASVRCGACGYDLHAALFGELLSSRQEVLPDVALQVLGVVGDHECRTLECGQLECETELTGAVQLRVEVQAVHVDPAVVPDLDPWNG